MKNDPIIINSDSLGKLATKYQVIVGDIDTRVGKGYKWGTDPESFANVATTTLPLRLGGADFTEGVGLANVLETVRTGLVSRLKSVRKTTEDLGYALTWLVQDTNSTEDYANLTASDFQYYIPQSSSSSSSTGGQSSGQT